MKQLTYLFFYLKISVATTPLDMMSKVDVNWTSEEVMEILGVWLGCWGMTSIDRDASGSVDRCSADAMPATGRRQ